MNAPGKALIIVSLLNIIITTTCVVIMITDNDAVDSCNLLWQYLFASAVVYFMAGLHTCGVCDDHETPMTNTQFSRKICYNLICRLICSIVLISCGSVILNMIEDSCRSSYITEYYGLWCMFIILFVIEIVLIVVITALFILLARNKNREEQESQEEQETLNRSYSMV